MKKINVLYSIILLSIFSMSLYIRGFLPFDSVFSGSFIGFGGNDPWYNFRLVENTLHNFPHRIYFDAFTYYPHGTNVPFAPLFDYFVASVIWFIGLGSPYTVLGEEGIKTIFAFFPVVLGAMVIVPVYFIGEELWNKNVGILSAIVIAVLPGQFLSRSLLGFTDHHVMEVLMSAIVILVLIKTIKVSRFIVLKDINKTNWSTLKKPISYSLLFGLSLGAFYLSWSGAPLLMVVFMVYGIIQYTIDYIRENGSNYLVITSIPAFIVSFLMVIPFLFTPYKRFVELQVISPLLGISIFLILGIISYVYQKRNVNITGYLMTILTVSILSIMFISLTVPEVYQRLLGRLGIIFPSGVQLTIQEVNPMQMVHILRWFSTPFFVAALGFVLLGWNIIKKVKPEEVLFLVWSLLILFACFGQNRFAYYYAVNVSLLCGFLSWKVIEYVKSIDKSKESKVKGKHNKKNLNHPNKRYNLIGVSVLIFLVVVCPPLNTSLSTAKYSAKIPVDWYDTLIWMKENTPEMDLGYYDIYDSPSNRQNYNYSNSTYGVMSWWDYGHWITTISHRIPIANPFQQGAYEAAEYLIETDEAKANIMLDNLNVKYVIIDYPMIDFMNAPTNPNPKYVMPIWAKKSPNPLQTIEGRLYYFDGSEFSSLGIESLQRYRLVYESSTFVFPYLVIDSSTNQTLGWSAYHGSYEGIKNDINILHQGAMMRGQEPLMVRAPEFFHPVGFVKVFEYVEGRIIRENATTNTSLTLCINITTNQGREFTYTQTQISKDGYCEFVVPYEEEYSICNEVGIKDDNK